MKFIGGIGPVVETNESQTDVDRHGNHNNLKVKRGGVGLEARAAEAECVSAAAWPFEGIGIEESFAFAGKRGRDKTTLLFEIGSNDHDIRMIVIIGEVYTST